MVVSRLFISSFQPHSRLVIFKSSLPRTTHDEFNDIRSIACCFFVCYWIIVHITWTLKVDKWALKFEKVYFSYICTANEDNLYLKIRDLWINSRCVRFSQSRIWHIFNGVKKYFINKLYEFKDIVCGSDRVIKFIRSVKYNNVLVIDKARFKIWLIIRKKLNAQTA